MTLRARDYLFGAVALAVAATCARLGFWQLERLAQRRARNAEVRAARERPVLEISGRSALASLDSVRHRRVRARGVYDYDHERLWRARTHEGVPGVNVIAPLRLGDGSAVFVDRGWVPSPDAARVDQRAYRDGDSAVAEGLGMMAPRGRGDVDPKALADSLPYPLLPFVIQQLPADRPSARPPVRLLPPALDDGPHLAYAIQWFSFAAIIVVGSIALYRQRGQ